MIIAALLAAAQPGAPPPENPRLACAPRLVMTAAGPPPAVFHAQRMEVAPERRVFLSLHRCGAGDHRVELRRTGAGEAEREPEWVPVSQCPALGAWAESTARLSLPSPMLREHRPETRPPGGIWFTLNARTLTGPGWLGSLELQILEPPGAPPNALSGWFREGERVFRACRDRGHGGEGHAPDPGRLRR